MDKIRDLVLEFLFVSLAVTTGVFWGLFWWFFFLVALDMVLGTKSATVNL